MVPALIVLGFAAYFGAIALGQFPPFNAAVLIRIRGGSVALAKGNLRHGVRGDVQDVLAEFGIRTGFIAITAGNKTYFSRSIPNAAHQRLRNVLLSRF